VNDSRAAFLRVGLLVIIGIGLVIGLIWFFGGARLAHGTLYESYFRESVQGLEVGAPVKYRGVTVGRVSELGLVSAEYGNHNGPVQLDRQTYRLVFVRFVVDRTLIGQVPDTEAAVKLGLRVRLASQGITGLTYLELDFADPTQYPAQQVPWSPRDDYIPSMPSTLLQVQNAATQFLAKLNKLDIDTLAAALTGLVTDARASLDHGDLHRTLADSSDLLRTLNDVVQRADVPELTANLRQTSTSLRTLADSHDLHHTLANAAEISDRLAAASAQLQSLITALQSTTRRIDNTTGDLQQGLLPILRDAQGAVANLRDTTDELRRYPAQILLSAPPERTREPAK
jgi:ABC-type transporter Mla subunit MlaD